MNNGPEIDRNDIAVAIEDKYGIDKQTTVDVLKALGDVLPHFLAEYGRVEIHQFGIFHLDERQARTGWDFVNKVPVMIPYRHKINFTASRHMADLTSDITEVDAY